jgi:hypothetical protein
MDEGLDGAYGFFIGHQPTLRLSVAHLRHSNGEWHAFRAEAAAPGFKACFDFGAQLGEFAALSGQIKRMHETLQGKVQFETLEANVGLDGTIDHLGHVAWLVLLRSKAPGEAFPELSFRIDADQTMLAGVAAKVDHMIGSLAVP